MKAKVLHADTSELQKKAFDVRQEVFVGEQKVNPEDEFDEFEPVSHHFVVLDDDEPIGAARWRKTEKGIKLERFAVKKTYRGKGIGSNLVEEVLEDIQKHEGTGKSIYLHAQLSAVRLYEKFGFKAEGEKFQECNIWHYYMHKLS